MVAIVVLLLNIAKTETMDTISGSFNDGPFTEMIDLFNNASPFMLSNSLLKQN